MPSDLSTGWCKRVKISLDLPLAYKYIDSIIDCLVYGLANRKTLKFKESFVQELKEKLKGMALDMEQAKKIEVLI